MSRHGLSSRDAPGLERVLGSLLDPLSHPEVDAWRSTVNRALAHLLGADMLSFQLPLPGHSLFYTDAQDGEAVRRYTDHHIPDLVRRKRYFARILQLGVGNRAMLWGAEMDWLYASAYYNEVIVPMRAFDPVWAAVPTPGTDVPTILLAHHDRRGGRRFGGRGLEIMRVIRPALAAAVATVRRLHGQQTALAGTLDRLPSGALLFDLEGGMLHQNTAATRILTTDPQAESIRGEARRVARAASGDSPVEPANGGPDVQAAVATALGTYHVHATRLAADTLLSTPVVLVLIEGGRRELPTVAEVQGRFDLTHRQAEVAILLAQRKTNDEIAETLRISPNTARHHTEAVMLELGVRSRREVAPKLKDAG